METRTHRFEMALTLAELCRLAPHIDPRHPVTPLEDGVSGAWGEGECRWSLRLSGARERRIALLRFPIADVTLRLEGFAPQQEAGFLARFHLVYRKGGG